MWQKVYSTLFFEETSSHTRTLGQTRALLVDKLGTASYALDFNYTKAYFFMLPFTVLAYKFARAILTCIWFDSCMFVQMKLVWLLSQKRLSTTLKWTDHFCPCGKKYTQLSSLKRHQAIQGP
jgi:hypothetical protein